ncbi:LexA/Signal peptidase [Parathielavia appendiculata]|uniref:Mitochondrial inner membrane protease subunit 2 n=1 Tax=Parathielavia appendiculata TaxID=2587402 RepID=A0AAN6Z6Q5_9PEZI|nr:LexA/Signal peptidase [Parathielavia appendiculata]
MATWTANRGGRSRFLRQVSHYLFRYATWIPPLIWFNAYVAQVTFIRGPSMYPFLNPQYNKSLREDLCLVWKLYAQEGLRRGMVVTFSRNPYDPNKVTVKRIVGLEGDVVKTKHPYPYDYVAVPEGHIWVEGDGDKSQDSNYYGPISVRLVTGRVTHVLSPWERAGRVRWWEHPLRMGVHRAA